MQIKRIIIGLEVHIELKTLSKMFCSCDANHFGVAPNTHTCPVCLGLPGALPVPNKKAIIWTMALGDFVGGKIANHSHFDRKNYFYPDLPKGYQISQYDEPFVKGGQIILDDDSVIRLTRVHLEEDTAKLQHQVVDGQKTTLIDFNRSGVALMEIVSGPDATSSDQAKSYLEKLQQTVRYLGISDADMEKGSMRCEPNVNLEIEKEGQLFYTPTSELKNINSFRFAKKAIDYEVNRQFEEFTKTGITKTKGNKQTRGWDESKNETVLQRQKEEADDYRYFPEPDIPPFVFTDEDIASLIIEYKNIENPHDKKVRLMKQYSITPYQAIILTADQDTADFFEETCALASGKIETVVIANAIINKRYPQAKSPAALLAAIDISKISVEVSSEDMDKLIDKLILDNPDVVAGYRSGKEQALGKIVGLIKKENNILVSIDQIKARIKDA